MFAVPLLAALTVSSFAHAGWPKPAGGPSASGAPEVVLTFDDGPHQRFTNAILDELHARGLQAIFFWVGRRLVVDGHPRPERVAVLERAVREGHLIANHTISHPNLCLISPELAAHEIDDNRRILERFSGLPIILFRAPYGAYCRRLRALLAERGIAHMHWDIDPQEWEHHSSKRAARYVINKLDQLEGRAILLMHDTQFATVRALPEILDWIEAENERRKKRGRRPPIRIVSGSELVAEQVDHEMASWLARAATGAADRAGHVLSSLIP